MICSWKAQYPSHNKVRSHESSLFNKKTLNDSQSLEFFHDWKNLQRTAGMHWGSLALPGYKQTLMSFGKKRVEWGLAYHLSSFTYWLSNEGSQLFSHGPKSAGGKSIHDKKWVLPENKAPQDPMDENIIFLVNSKEKDICNNNIAQSIILPLRMTRISYIPVQSRW